MLRSVMKLRGLLGSYFDCRIIWKQCPCQKQLGSGYTARIQTHSSSRRWIRNVTKNEIRKKGVIDCDKCVCAYPNALWALFVFPFTALTHALVPAWLTSSCMFPLSGMNAQKIHTKDDKLSEL